MVLRSAVMIGLVMVTPVLAQSEPPKRPVDQSIAGNTQQAAGQLGEINKKLGLVIERMDAMSARRPPLVIPTTTACTSESCSERADSFCKRIGYTHGVMVNQNATPTSTWVCLD